ncbi:hypothetical protein ACFQ8C_06210 [Streptomyces sp. NPDC056503]|uniref:hypothetical protein n=1 Tax=Streptomyces sp. NPDC056503 TaxID=3345842 RepID=UPI0036C45BF0
MRSPQVLSKGDHTAILRDDHLTIEQDRIVTTVPLAAVEEVRQTGATTLALVLTDGVTRPLPEGNTYSAPAFRTAVTEALPRRRDPAGSALLTTTEGRGSIPRWAVWLGVLGFLGAYTAYVWWTGAAHGGAMGAAAFGAVPGLLIGGLGAVGAVNSARDRTLLARRGITVVATRAYYPNGKRAGHYTFTDASGNELTTHYGSGRATNEIHVVYDPEAPSRRHAASEPAYATVVKHALGLLTAGAVLALGLWGALAPYL